MLLGPAVPAAPDLSSVPALGTLIPSVGHPAEAPSREAGWVEGGADVAIPAPRHEDVAHCDDTRRGSADGAARDIEHGSAGASPHQVKGHSFADWREAEAKATTCVRYLELIGAPTHYGLNQAAVALGKAPAFFSGSNSMYSRWRREGVAGLLPRRRDCGTKPSFIVPAWFIPAAKFFWLITNRNVNGGSVPEAIRRVISLPALPVGWRPNDTLRFGRAMRDVGQPVIPTCPPELRELILARERAGTPLVPERIARQILADRSTVDAYRNPTEAALKHVSAPGTMMWKRGEGVAERIFLRAGDVIEADDGTINFPVCVPWTMGGCPCSDKFGVKVGRFQFLRPIDAGSRFRPGYVYVARPRGSYRREDVLALMRMVARTMGIPRSWRFERGTWETQMVEDAAKHLGSDVHHVFSPRSKPFVEGGFSDDWKKLSLHFPGADVGRFMGETEEANVFLTKCKKGTQDPRQMFPLLETALAAFDAITMEQNRSPVNSANYGRWIPEERLADHLAARPLRRLNPESDWIFSPYVRDWTVRGMLVGGKVPIFEEVSVPFDFSAPWLPQYHGAKVRCHFDPSEARCAATLVLLENHGPHRAGDVLGPALQINETAGYVRLVMGWGDDPVSLGRRQRQQAASAMRREVRHILPRQGPNIPAPTGISEMRDGLGQKVVIDRDVIDRDVAPLVNRKSEIGNPSVEIASAREQAARFERDNAHLFV